MSDITLSDSTHEITLRLSQALIERLESAAESQHLPVAQVVSEALDITLPPAKIRVQAEQRLQAAIENLSRQTAAQWQAHTKVEMTKEEKRQAARLLSASKTRELSAEETAAMQALLERNEAVATERAAALWLLKMQQRKHGSLA